MICIKSIEIVEVDRDQMEIQSRGPMPDWYFPLDDAGADPIDMKIATELIHGRHFVFRGKEFVIGMSKDVQDILGMPFAAIDVMEFNEKNMIRQEYRSNQLNKKLIRKLLAYEDMSFFQKVKFVFS